MKTTTAFLFAFCLLPAIAAAATTVDETRVTDPNPEISVEVIVGSIRIVGWDRSEVHITGTLGSGVEGLDISSDRDEVEIEVLYPDRRDGRLKDAEVNLVISVPLGSDIEIETVKGTIEVVDVSGELSLETIQGGITVVGPAAVVEAVTVNGDIHISGFNSEVEAESVSGMIVVTGATGSISVSTVNGTIEVDASQAESVSLESMAGSIQFRGDLAEKGDLSVEAHSSSIVLVLPSTISASFDIQTQSGDIENEFGPRPERVGGFMPGKILEFSLGSGSADVSVETFAGNVKLVKGDG